MILEIGMFDMRLLTKSLKCSRCFSVTSSCICKVMRDASTCETWAAKIRRSRITSSVFTLESR